jgi:hypothetical protein
VLGWPVRPGNSFVFAGTIGEFVKEPWTVRTGTSPSALTTSTGLVAYGEARRNIRLGKRQV